MPGRRTIVAFALGLALVAPAQAALAKPRPVVIGYLAAFHNMKGTLAATDLGKLTHLNLAFVNPGPDASIVTGDHMSCMDTNPGSTPVQDIRDIVAAAHAKGVKVLASLGGGKIPACAGDWPGLLQGNKSAVLVANLLQFVDDYDLDGLDVDLEWDVLMAIETGDHYVPFVAELSKGLKKRGKLLTCATASHPGGMVPQASLRYFSYVNIMAYDTIGPSWGTPGDEHATLAQAEADIATWQTLGLPKAKLILGVPFYGYGFNGYDRGYPYKTILATFGPSAADTDVQGQACAGCQYVTYNGRATIQAKARLALQKGAGVMIWELSEDAPAPDSLLEAVDEALNPREP